MEALPQKIDRYQIRELLGEGTFGVVYRAFDPQVERYVALKVLRAEHMTSARAIARFLREAKAAGKLHHRHIVPVYDAGPAGEFHYIVSKFIEGTTLKSAIPAGGMDPRQAAILVAQLASALGHAHREGVLHRDVKPENIMLDRQRELYLMDFGLAGWMLEESMQLSQEGTVVGTLHYMSPEKVTGGRAREGPGSDLYSAGVVLYQLLTGRLPFEQEQDDPAALLYQIAHGVPPPPSQRRPGLDAALEAMCLTAMAGDPEQRYRTGEEMAEKLFDWAKAAQSLAMPEATANRSSLIVDQRTDSELLGRPVLAPVANMGEEITNSFGMRLKLIQPGRFLMGSRVGENGQFGDEQPQHPVSITRPFYVGVYPVTQEEYVRVTGKQNPSWFSKNGQGKGKIENLDTERFPVENVSWHEAKAICDLLNQRDTSQLSGWKYRLPTEAQWEYACRAGTTTSFFFGDDANDLFDYAMFDSNSEDRTWEVGSRQPNQWGLYDMHGNVLQWCEDYFDAGYYSKSSNTDPQNIEEAAARVLRGGSWDFHRRYCRAAVRYWFPPASRYNFVGCRVCLSLD